MEKQDCNLERLIDWSLAPVVRMRGAPAMQKRGYTKGYGAATVAAGALLGPIIPPSIPMVVYAQIANVSVIRMLLAGVVPGLLLAAGFFALCTLDPVYFGAGS